MKWSGHPVWLVGFRPFFLLAGMAGVALPLVWAHVLSGALAPPRGLLITAWHAHEMFFGFGMAVLGGFLLTATKNWVKVRGHHGRALQVLVAAWLLERAALWWGDAWPQGLSIISRHLFLGTLVALIMWTLVRHRASDSYRDNFIFLLVLPLFIVAKALMLDPAQFAVGRDLTLGLFRMAFLVMLERTVVPFMKGAFQVTLPQYFVLDSSIKALGMVLVFSPFLPDTVQGVFSLILAALVLGRFVMWFPHRALTQLDVGVMYLGGLALATQLALEGLSALTALTWPFSLSMHVFTLGTMGLIIPAMMTRISKGHTGRPVAFDVYDKVALWMMLVGFVARVIAPQLMAEQYKMWIWTAAGCWAGCFMLITIRMAPRLLRPRIDGKEH